MIDFEDKQVLVSILVGGIVFFLIIRKILGFLSNDRDMKTYDPASMKHTAASDSLSNKVMEYDPMALNERAEKAKQENTSWTAAQVAEHNTPDDCWIIFEDKVYDVTTFVALHPGGDAITNHAGKDNTRPILDQGSHPVLRVKRDLAVFYIGKLASSKKSQ